MLMIFDKSVEDICREGDPILDLELVNRGLAAHEGFAKDPYGSCIGFGMHFPSTCKSYRDACNGFKGFDLAMNGIISILDRMRDADTAVGVCCNLVLTFPPGMGQEVITTLMQFYVKRFFLRSSIECGGVSGLIHTYDLGFLKEGITDEYRGHNFRGILSGGILCIRLSGDVTYDTRLLRGVLSYRASHFGVDSFLTVIVNEFSALLYTGDGFNGTSFWNPFFRGSGFSHYYTYYLNDREDGDIDMGELVSKLDSVI